VPVLFIVKEPSQGDRAVESESICHFPLGHTLQEPREVSFRFERTEGLGRLPMIASAKGGIGTGY
jgi:hypothetical protein